MFNRKLLEATNKTPKKPPPSQRITPSRSQNGRQTPRHNLPVPSPQVTPFAHRTTPARERSKDERQSSATLLRRQTPAHGVPSLLPSTSIHSVDMVSDERDEREQQPEWTNQNGITPVLPWAFTRAQELYGNGAVLHGTTTMDQVLSKINHDGDDDDDTLGQQFKASTAAIDSTKPILVPYGAKPLLIIRNPVLSYEGSHAGSSSPHHSFVFSQEELMDAFRVQTVSARKQGYLSQCITTCITVYERVRRLNLTYQTEYHELKQQYRQEVETQTTPPQHIPSEDTSKMDDSDSQVPPSPSIQQTSSPSPSNSDSILKSMETKRKSAQIYMKIAMMLLAMIKYAQHLVHKYDRLSQIRSSPFTQDVSPFLFLTTVRFPWLNTYYHPHSSPHMVKGAQQESLQPSTLTKSEIKRQATTHPSQDSVSSHTLQHDISSTHLSSDALPSTSSTRHTDDGHTPDATNTTPDSQHSKQQLTMHQQEHVTNQAVDATLLDSEPKHSSYAIQLPQSTHAGSTHGPCLHLIASPAVSRREPYLRLVVRIRRRRLKPSRRVDSQRLSAFYLANLQLTQKLIFYCTPIDLLHLSSASRHIALLSAPQHPLGLTQQRTLTWLKEQYDLHLMTLMQASRQTGQPYQTPTKVSHRPDRLDGITPRSQLPPQTPDAAAPAIAGGATTTMSISLLDSDDDDDVHELKHTTHHNGPDRASHRQPTLQHTPQMQSRQSNIKMEYTIPPPTNSTEGFMNPLPPITLIGYVSNYYIFNQLFEPTFHNSATTTTPGRGPQTDPVNPVKTQPPLKSQVNTLEVIDLSSEMSDAFSTQTKNEIDQQEIHPQDTISSSMDTMNDIDFFFASLKTPQPLCGSNVAADHILAQQKAEIECETMYMCRGPHAAQKTEGIQTTLDSSGVDIQTSQTPQHDAFSNSSQAPAEPTPTPTFPSILALSFQQRPNPPEIIHRGNHGGASLPTPPALQSMVPSIDDFMTQSIPLHTPVMHDITTADLTPSPQTSNDLLSRMTASLSKTYQSDYLSFVKNNMNTMDHNSPESSHSNSHREGSPTLNKINPSLSSVFYLSKLINTLKLTSMPPHLVLLITNQYRYLKPIFGRFHTDGSIHPVAGQRAPPALFSLPTKNQRQYPEPNAQHAPSIAIGENNAGESPRSPSTFAMPLDYAVFNPVTLYGNHIYNYLLSSPQTELYAHAYRHVLSTHFLLPIHHTHHNHIYRRSVRTVDSFSPSPSQTNQPGNLSRTPPMAGTSDFQTISRRSSEILDSLWKRPTVYQFLRRMFHLDFNTALKYLTQGKGDIPSAAVAADGDGAVPAQQPMSESIQNQITPSHQPSQLRDRMNSSQSPTILPPIASTSTSTSSSHSTAFLQHYYPLRDMITLAPHFFTFNTHDALINLKFYANGKSIITELLSQQQQQGNNLGAHSNVRPSSDPFSSARFEHQISFLRSGLRTVQQQHRDLSTRIARLGELRREHQYKLTRRLKTHHQLDSIDSTLTTLASPQYQENMDELQGVFDISPREVESDSDDDDDDYVYNHIMMMMDSMSDDDLDPSDNPYIQHKPTSFLSKLADQGALYHLSQFHIHFNPLKQLSMERRRNQTNMAHRPPPIHSLIQDVTHLPSAPHEYIDTNGNIINEMFFLPTQPVAPPMLTMNTYSRQQQLLKKQSRLTRIQLMLEKLYKSIADPNINNAFSCWGASPTTLVTASQEDVQKDTQKKASGGVNVSQNTLTIELIDDDANNSMDTSQRDTQRQQASQTKRKKTKGGVSNNDDDDADITDVEQIVHVIGISPDDKLAIQPIVPPLPLSPDTTTMAESIGVPSPTDSRGAVSPSGHDSRPLNAKQNDIPPHLQSIPAALQTPPLQQSPPPWCVIPPDLLSHLITTHCITLVHQYIDITSYRCCATCKDLPYCCGDEPVQCDDDISFTTSATDELGLVTLKQAQRLYRFIFPPVYAFLMKRKTFTSIHDITTIPPHTKAQHSANAFQFGPAIPQYDDPFTSSSLCNVLLMIFTQYFFSSHAPLLKAIEPLHEPALEPEPIDSTNDATRDSTTHIDSSFNSVTTFLLSPSDTSPNEPIERSSAHVHDDDDNEDRNGYEHAHAGEMTLNVIGQQLVYFSELVFFEAYNQPLAAFPSFFHPHDYIFQNEHVNVKPFVPQSLAQILPSDITNRLDGSELELDSAAETYAFNHTYETSETAQDKTQQQQQQQQQKGQSVHGSNIHSASYKYKHPITFTTLCLFFATATYQQCNILCFFNIQVVPFLRFTLSMLHLKQHPAYILSLLALFCTHSTLSFRSMHALLAIQQQQRQLVEVNTLSMISGRQQRDKILELLHIRDDANDAASTTTTTTTTQNEQSSIDTGQPLHLFSPPTVQETPLQSQYYPHVRTMTFYEWSHQRALSQQTIRHLLIVLGFRQYNVAPFNRIFTRPTFYVHTYGASSAPASNEPKQHSQTFSRQPHGGANDGISDGQVEMPMTPLPLGGWQSSASSSASTSHQSTPSNKRININTLEITTDGHINKDTTTMEDDHVIIKKSEDDSSLSRPAGNTSDQLLVQHRNALRAKHANRLTRSLIRYQGRDYLSLLVFELTSFADQYTLCMSEIKLNSMVTQHRGCGGGDEPPSTALQQTNGVISTSTSDILQPRLVEQFSVDPTVNNAVIYHQQHVASYAQFHINQGHQQQQPNIMNDQEDNDNGYHINYVTIPSDYFRTSVMPQSQAYTLLSLYLSHHPYSQAVSLRLPSPHPHSQPESEVHPSTERVMHSLQNNHHQSGYNMTTIANPSFPCFASPQSMIAWSPIDIRIPNVRPPRMGQMDHILLINGMTTSILRLVSGIQTIPLYVVDACLQSLFSTIQQQQQQQQQHSISRSSSLPSSSTQPTKTIDKLIHTKKFLSFLGIKSYGQTTIPLPPYLPPSQPLPPTTKPQPNHHLTSLLIGGEQIRNILSILLTSLYAQYCYLWCLQHGLYGLFLPSHPTAAASATSTHLHHPHATLLALVNHDEIVSMILRDKQHKVRQLRRERARRFQYYRYLRSITDPTELFDLPTPQKNHEMIETEYQQGIALLNFITDLILLQSPSHVYHQHQSSPRKASTPPVDSSRGTSIPPGDSSSGTRLGGLGTTTSSLVSDLPTATQPSGAAHSLEQQLHHMLNIHDDIHVYYLFYIVRQWHALTLHTRYKLEPQTLILPSKTPFVPIHTIDMTEMTTTDVADNNDINDDDDAAPFTVSSFITVLTSYNQFDPLSIHPLLTDLILSWGKNGQTQSIGTGRLHAVGEMVWFSIPAILFYNSVISSIITSPYSLSHQFTSETGWFRRDMSNMTSIYTRGLFFQYWMQQIPPWLYISMLNFIQVIPSGFNITNQLDKLKRRIVSESQFQTQLGLNGIGDISTHPHQYRVIHDRIQSISTTSQYVEMLEDLSIMKFAGKTPTTQPPPYGWYSGLMRVNSSLYGMLAVVALHTIARYMHLNPLHTTDSLQQQHQPQLKTYPRIPFYYGDHPLSPLNTASPSSIWCCPYLQQPIDWILASSLLSRTIDIRLPSSPSSSAVTATATAPVRAQGPIQLTPLYPLTYKSLQYHWIMQQHMFSIYFRLYSTYPQHLIQSTFFKPCPPRTLPVLITSTSTSTSSSESSYDVHGDDNHQILHDIHALTYYQSPSPTSSLRNQSVTLTELEPTSLHFTPLHELSSMHPGDREYQSIPPFPSQTGWTWQVFHAWFGFVKGSLHPFINRETQGATSSSSGHNPNHAKTRTLSQYQSTMRDDVHANKSLPASNENHMTIEALYGQYTPLFRVWHMNSHDSNGETTPIQFPTLFLTFYTPSDNYLASISAGTSSNTVHDRFTTSTPTIPSASPSSSHATTTTTLALDLLDPQTTTNTTFEKWYDSNQTPSLHPMSGAMTARFSPRWQHGGDRRDGGSEALLPSLMLDQDDTAGRQEHRYGQGEAQGQGHGHPSNKLHSVDRSPLSRSMAREAGQPSSSFARALLPEKHQQHGNEHHPSQTTTMVQEFVFLHCVFSPQYASHYISSLRLPVHKKLFPLLYNRLNDSTQDIFGNMLTIQRQLNVEMLDGLRQVSTSLTVSTTTTTSTSTSLQNQNMSQLFWTLTDSLLRPSLPFCDNSALSFSKSVVTALRQAVSEAVGIEKTPPLATTLTTTPSSDESQSPFPDIEFNSTPVTAQRPDNTSTHNNDNNNENDTTTRHLALSQRLSMILFKLVYPKFISLIPSITTLFGMHSSSLAVAPSTLAILIPRIQHLIYRYTVKDGGSLSSTQQNAQQNPPPIASTVSMITYAIIQNIKQSLHEQPIDVVLLLSLISTPTPVFHAIYTGTTKRPAKVQGKPTTSTPKATPDDRHDEDELIVDLSDWEDSEDELMPQLSTRRAKHLGLFGINTYKRKDEIRSQSKRTNSNLPHQSQSLLQRVHLSRKHAFDDDKPKYVPTKTYARPYFDRHRPQKDRVRTTKVQMRSFTKNLRRLNKRIIRRNPNDPQDDDGDSDDDVYSDEDDDDDDYNDDDDNPSADAFSRVPIESILHGVPEAERAGLLELMQRVQAGNRDASDLSDNSDIDIDDISSDDDDDVRSSHYSSQRQPPPRRKNVSKRIPSKHLAKTTLPLRRTTRVRNTNVQYSFDGDGDHDNDDNNEQSPNEISSPDNMMEMYHRTLGKKQRGSRRRNASPEAETKKRKRPIGSRSVLMKDATVEVPTDRMNMEMQMDTGNGSSNTLAIDDMDLHRLPDLDDLPEIDESFLPPMESYQDPTDMSDIADIPSIDQLLMNVLYKND